MTIKAQIKDILLKNFHSVYCDTCENINTSECDYCHRKAMSWSLSQAEANRIAEDILAKVIIEEKQYEYYSSYVINCGEPRCLGTKEMDICDCEGNKYKCSFYNLTSK